jgi:hypothetical protein
MVDWFGRWHEEKDYSTYPEEKWCDYDHMANWIRKQGYEPKNNTMEQLIDMIFLHYEGECEDEDKEFNVEDCMEYVRNSGGIEMFDYEP